MPIRSWQPLINLGFGLGIGITAMVVGHLSPAMQRGELALYDWRLATRTSQADPRIVLVPLAAETLQDRRALAGIITAVGRQGAKVIGVDAPLDSHADPAADQVLTDAFARTTSVVVAAHLTDALPLRYTRPLPEFRVTDGLSLPIRDADGQVRRTTLLFPVTTTAGNLVLRPTYLLEVLRRIDPALAAVRQTEAGSSTWGFRWPERSWPTIQSAEVTAGQQDLKGRIVLLGEASSLGWQAAAIQALLDGSRIRSVGRAWNFGMCLLAGTVAGLAFWSGRTLAGITGTLALTGGLIAVNTAVLTVGNQWAYLLGPLLAALATGVSGGILTGIEQFRRRRQVARFFRPYVSPQTVQALLRDSDNLPDMKSERRVVTVLFSDIAGFTSISERLPTEEVVELLNEYLTAMTKIIFLNNGTLDKYIGDEVMAVFGNIGPNDPPDDAYRAVKSSLEMQEELGHLQEKWLAEGIVPLQIRIGINSGEALVGNIGSPQQMDFTVIGDMVNTAKRLEGLNKAYNTNILISQATFNYVKDRVETRFLGPAPIKGRHEPVPVYGLLGWPNGKPPA